MNTQKCYWCGAERPPRSVPNGTQAAKAKAKATAQANGGDATQQDLREEIKGLEEMMKKCPKGNAHLAMAKAESEKRLAEHIENKQSDIPLCFTEVQVNRNLRKEQAKLWALSRCLRT